MTGKAKEHNHCSMHIQIAVCARHITKIKIFFKESHHLIYFPVQKPMSLLRKICC